MGCMQKPKFIWGILVLGVFFLAACSKANAPTNSNFEAAIKKYMAKHQKTFTLYSGAFPRNVALKDNNILCETVGIMGSNGYSQCSFPVDKFRTMKNAGFYVQHGEVPLGTVTERNPTFSTEMAQYNKDMAKYKKSMIEYKRKMKAYNDKIEENEAAYRKEVKKYTAKAKKKAKWCINQNIGASALPTPKNGLPPPDCGIFIAQTFSRISNLSDSLAFDAGRATHNAYPDFLPAPPSRPVNPVVPTKPAEPSKPTNKFISVPKSYPAFVVSGGNSSCSINNCQASVGKLEFSKIISATQPATNADGVIVSQVRFTTKPVLLQNANVLPKDPTETTERIFAISLVKQTQGWTGEGPNGGIIPLQ
ncbi:hypothetical protein ABH19_04000 [Leptospirillum sp. Group II 'CF-1']|nr:hypothetical protein ABH19_04000 [Leptospirillum sp. Group II 'CF-1']